METLKDDKTNKKDDEEEEEEEECFRIHIRGSNVDGTHSYHFGLGFSNIK